MKDFLFFKAMITPLIIQALFWVGAGLCLLMGFVMIAMGVSTGGSGSMVLGGIIFILLGPVWVRVQCEAIIIFFKIHETLGEIRNNTGPAKPPEPKPSA